MSYSLINVFEGLFVLFIFSDFLFGFGFLFLFLRGDEMTIRGI